MAAQILSHTHVITRGVQATAHSTPVNNKSLLFKSFGKILQSCLLSEKRLKASSPSIYLSSVLHRIAGQRSIHNFPAYGFPFGKNIDTNYFVFDTEVLDRVSLEKHVREIVHKAFWEKLAEELNQDPPNYTQALALIADVKQSLLSLLLPHHNSLRTKINEVLDIELITQQAQHSALDISQLAKFVVSVLGKLCAPVRDEKVQSLLQIDNIVTLFKEIFSVIDVMKMDMANFQLQAIKPQLLQHSVEYERKKFKDYLERNPNGLLSTKEWMKRGVEDVIHKQSGVTVAPVVKTDGTPTQTISTGIDNTDSVLTIQNVNLTDVLTSSYLGIIFGEGGFPYPETLIMDEHRLSEMRWNVHRTTLVGTILLVTMNTIGRQLAGDAGYIGKLKEVVYILLDGVPECELQATLPNVCEQVISETNTFLTSRGFETLNKEKEEMIRSQMKGLNSPDHALFKLLRNRALEFIKASLKRRGGINHVEVPQGLSLVKLEITELAGRFLRLAGHNTDVYLPFYEEIYHSLKMEEKQS